MRCDPPEKMAAAGGPAAAAAAANRLSASVGLSTGNEATAVAAAVSSFPPTSAAAARSPKLVRNVGNGVVGGLLARDSGGSREPRSDWRRKQLRKVRSVELDGLLEPAECAELPLSASAAAATTDNPSPSSFAAVQPAPSSSRGFLLVAEQPLADSGSQAGAAERTVEPPLAGLYSSQEHHLLNLGLSFVPTSGYNHFQTQGIHKLFALPWKNMSGSNLAERVETWLSSVWHIKVPVQWLQACIDWIQEENGFNNLTQAYINKQVFEQWLLTDLRDLEYPVLPDCILNTPKGELKGFYSIQIDSVVDVSQPAYSQLQKIRGKNTVNEDITVDTQGTQKSWEAKSPRMLMLKLTDGINHIQGMEYRSVPVLHSSLSPGTKIMIQGKVAYRLGVILLNSENVRLLGGEVDSLMEEYAEERVLANLIGEDAFPSTVRSVTGDPGISRPIDEVGQVLELSDEELLANLEENEELMINEAPLESGYCSRSTSSNSNTYSLLPSNASCSDQSSAIIAANDQLPIPISEHIGEDLDEFPLDDDLLLVEEIQEQPEAQNRKKSPSREDKSVKRGMCDVFDNGTNDASVYLDDCSKNKRVHKRCYTTDVIRNKEKLFDISNSGGTNAVSNQYSDYIQAQGITTILDMPPFTYISVLLSNKPKGMTNVKVKAFIVTLTGKLTSSSGLWSITAKISDGTAYLEVDFANEILISLIGFSVPEMKQMKKNPILHPKIKEGLQNCQRELIDLCCLMTIEFNPSEAKATVIVLQDFNANDLNNLKRRLNIIHM